MTVLRWATGCVAAVSVVLLAGGVALSYIDRHLVPVSGWNFPDIFEEVTFMAVPVVGFVLASRRPGNRVGWIFLGAGLVLGLGFFCDRYGPRGLIAAPGSVPAARAAAWFVNWVWLIPAAGLAFILLLFPTGRLLSRRWRPAAWFVAVVLTLDTTAYVARAFRVWADPFTAPRHGWNPGLHTAIYILWPAAMLVGVASMVVRFARSSGEERLQLKWFAAAVVLVVAAMIPLALIPESAVSPAVAGAAVSALKVVFCLALVCLYVAIAVAVLKYRLYDIDRVISRTLAYAIVTGVLAGVYAGLVLLATQVLRVHTPVAVAAATLAAAALFSPVRRRVQQRVDRRFNRAQYDTDQTVAAFATRLKDAVDLDTVCEDLGRVVQTALEPAHISVWTGRPGTPGSGR
jgi:fumarate reductase subunit D